MCSFEMDLSAPAAALAAALNNPEQFAQLMQQQQPQQQQQQALAAGQDGRTGAAAPNAAAAAAGQPAAIDQQRSVAEARHGLTQQDLTHFHQMFAGKVQQTFTQLQAHLETRLAELTANKRSTRRNQAAAAAAAAETPAVVAANAMDTDGAGAEGPTLVSSSEEDDSSDADDASPAARIMKGTRKDIMVGRLHTDMRSGRERSKVMKGFAKTFAKLISPAQAAAMSAPQLIATWQERGNGFMRLHDWAPLSGAELDPRVYLSHLEFDMPHDADIQEALATLRSNGGAEGGQCLLDMCVTRHAACQTPGATGTHTGSARRRTGAHSRATARSRCPAPAA
ncbi:hypothetical protein PLESTB_001536800 [Pleodorina starrii]|uniref:Uncharacterized protein n=1 Tax=Pleodorina starrii TaxID=330485 RepID=A0A9W6BX17_9CHLO|nr:hypothetical protein PLESTB_001536800 [Pleodorina starrii]